MNKSTSLPVWAGVAPIVALLVLAGSALNLGGWYAGLSALALLGGVTAAVHHAEVVAHRVGEPFGTLLLAIAITVIEVALIVSLMISGGPEAAALPRDTVFAAVMLILNVMVGLCLLVGGSRFHEQTFGQHGVHAALATLTAISILTMVLPNFTTTAPGPHYSASQLAFIAVVSLVLYGMFVLVQTVRHRDYFLPPQADLHQEEIHAEPPSTKVALLSLSLLLVSLVAVVLLAKGLAPTIERGVLAMGAPQALVGVIVAMVVLLPEGVAALQAARSNRLQTSLNLALGSALASIGLTIPAVAMVSLWTGWTLTLGLDTKSTVLLILSLLVTTQSLATGRTTVLHGTVHLVIGAVYLFTSVVP
ncbi:MAG TPA: ionic transporter y4hA [Aquabacterium sp.]|nr:ionic transporter y4hA [Aquabacterium sp.]